LIAGDLIDWSSSRDFSDSIKVPDLEGYVPHVSGDHAASNELIIRVQSAYDVAGKNNNGGRLNYVEKERGQERGERGKFVEGVVRR
jgi:hypothetical protein